MSVETASTQTFSARIEAGPDAAADALVLLDALSLRLDAFERYAVRLALAELVANSAAHGRNGRIDDRIDVEFTVTADLIECQVSDHGPGFDPSPCADRDGLGLVIVDRLATRWGTHRGGRSVWLELERDR